MSEKWETVQGKTAASRKATNGKPSGGLKVSKKQEAKIYTMEDVLPAGSVENMYASAFDPKASPKKKELNGSSKPATSKPKLQEKKVEKPKAPSTVQEAVKANIKVEDIKNLIEEVQQRWPESPLLWLRDVAEFLNRGLITVPKTEQNTVLGGDPASALTAMTKKVINAMLSKVDENMREVFFETCVANTAHDLAKDQCVTGWRVLTQLLGDLQPTAVTAHMPRYIELMNSYQNRPAVGNAILWSVGQAGNKSLHSGIKVWLEVMLPVVTMRHYTKYVVDYLGALLSLHNITPTTKLNKPVMDISSFLTVQETVFVSSNAMNKDLARVLRNFYPSLRNISVAGCRNHELFPALLPRLANMSNADQVTDTLEVLANCLTASPAALVHWHKLYTSHLPQSGQLLGYIVKKWNSFRADLDTPEMQETIEAFQDYNTSVANKEGLQLASQGCEAISSKFTTPGTAWFPWKTLSFILLIATGAIINLDFERSGGRFKNSNTGQFLTDIGHYDNVMAATSWTLATSATGAAWLEEKTHGGRVWAQTNLPIYWEDSKRAATPVLELARTKASEFGVWVGLGWDKVTEAWASAMASLEASFPGLETKLADFKLAGAKYLQVVVVRAQEVGQALKDGAVHLVSGEVDWVMVRKQMAEMVIKMQNQVVAAYKAIVVQINQLIAK